MKPMRKTLALFLVFSMLLGLVPVLAAAADRPTSGYCGGEGDGTNLQWKLSENGELTITGEGPMADYTQESPAPWLRNNYWSAANDAYYRLLLPDGLTRIGDYAFAGIRFIQPALCIPATVTEIGDYAFVGSSGLKEDLIIPDSVTSIGDYAFSGTDYGESRLMRVDLGKGLTHLGEGAFYNALWLTGEVDLPDGLTELSRVVFWCDSALEHVTFGKNLTKIGEGAFAGCVQLKGDLTLPEGLKEIGPYAFSECNRYFDPLVIPDSVEIIGEHAFEKCYGFPEIRIGEGVKRIGELAFFDCYRVTEPLVIPAGVSEIGKGAFASMDLLPEIVCKSPNFCVKDKALYSTDEKTLLCWPAGLSWSLSADDGVIVIDDWACAGNTASTGKLVIPEGVTEIGDDAFYESGAFSGLQLPQTLKRIGEGAFASCGKMTGALILPKGLETIGECAFEGTGFTGSLTIPGSVREIDAFAFTGSKALDGELVLEDGIEIIGESAFEDCGFSCNLWIPDSVKVIGPGAFMYSNIGGFAVIGKNVEQLGNNAFLDCPALSDVYFRGDAPKSHDMPRYLTSELLPFSYECKLHYLVESKGWTDSEYYHEEDGTLWINPISVYDGIFAEPFRDVAPGQYFTAPIAWAAGEEITTGKTATKFAPDDSCTRGQMVTFLWRAAGSPEPETKVSPFDDVDMDAYYAKAVLWASENGIVNGMGDGKFAPDKTVTRGQMATILYRYSDGEAEGANPFTDVAPDAYYYDAVRWAFASGVTTGKTATTFGPDSPCTRGQIVTFLYRAFEA